MEKWISVKDRLPGVGTKVLACFKAQFEWVMFTARMTRHDGVYAPGYATSTHWMPLPEPPAE
jgi:hypothetical protein